MTTGAIVIWLFILATLSIGGIGWAVQALVERAKVVLVLIAALLVRH